MSAIISTEAYGCYFNQGDVPCQGPQANVQGKCYTVTTSLEIAISDRWITGGITAAMPGGSWLGALVSGYVSDILGRKRAIQIGAIIWCIGSILVCASNGIPMLIVGRIVNGFSVGICSAQVPVYITEIAPPTKRGRLVGAQQCKLTSRSN
jgi:MFS family permease